MGAAGRFGSEKRLVLQMPRIPRKLIAKLAQYSGRSAAWLARLVRDQEVDGSNPFAPTTSKPFALNTFRLLSFRQSKQLCCVTM